MTGVRVSPSWLALREPADAAARAGDLVDLLVRELPARRPLEVHDLGCGTGSMLRWLAPRLPGPQHWVCYDLDTNLLAIAEREGGPWARGGSPVTVEVRRRDVTRLAPGECAGAALITTSALLDLLSSDELGRLVATCVAAACPALLTLSVCGRVEMWPPHPLDAVVGAAFDAHQRRVAGGRRLLGPDAAAATVRAFRRSGHDVVARPSAWHLGAEERWLTTAWFTGWLAAACEESPQLEPETSDYAAQRLADAAAGTLRVLVHHRDLLVRPPDRPGTAG